MAAAACQKWQLAGSAGAAMGAGSTTALGMAAAAAVLPPRTTVVAMKTPAVTAMVGAQTVEGKQRL